MSGVVCCWQAPWENPSPRAGVGINLLFWALVVVVAGSLLGEFLGINQLLGNLWSWFGHQGWEYLDLRRAGKSCSPWDWCCGPFCCFEGLHPLCATRNTKRYRGFTCSRPRRYRCSICRLSFSVVLPEYSIVDNWRFSIIHLWVEGFLELFVTVMVAVTFYRLGMVSRQTAVRVIYLDAILFLGSGIIGTGHHWYWTGQSDVNLALSALF